MQLSVTSSLANSVSPFMSGAKAAHPQVESTNPNTTLAPVAPLEATVASANRAADSNLVYAPRVRAKAAERPDAAKSAESGAVSEDTRAPDVRAEESTDPAAAEAEDIGTAGAQPASDSPEARASERAKARQEQLELEQIQELSARDREVRAHEQAHAAVGGQYAGAPSYSYQRGPDGRSYAIGGEVPIDVAPIAGDPEATLRKMEQVRRAALAPAEPSPQDRAVAAIATQQILQAQAELSRQIATEEAPASESAEVDPEEAQASDSSNETTSEPEAQATDASESEEPVFKDRIGIETYQNLLELGRRLEAAQTQTGFSAVA